jgi:tetratricopeptide (TPR) repeat protein
MADLNIYTDENLARKGRDFVRRGQFALANEFLSEYCARMMDQEKTIPPAVLAAYGLAVGMTTDLKEGIEICHRAINADRKNPEIYLNLARLHAQAGSRKKAVEAIERGLALSKNHRGLLDLLKDLGQRQSPPVPFLGRDNPLNVKLGRLLHRLRGTGRDKSKSRVIA